jgi:hypothetical protein
VNVKEIRQIAGSVSLSVGWSILVVIVAERPNEPLELVSDATLIGVVGMLAWFFHSNLSKLYMVSGRNMVYFPIISLLLLALFFLVRELIPGTQPTGSSSISELEGMLIRAVLYGWAVIDILDLITSMTHPLESPEHQTQNSSAE